MKKINFLFILLILSACTPQVMITQTSEVSETSEVLTPTPTPNSLRNDDQADLYIMRADGTNQVQLTNHPEPDWGARWIE